MPDTKPEFKVGDVVHLKSGGLAMTIVWVATDRPSHNGVQCGWFTPEHKYETAFIEQDALVVGRP